MEQTALRPKPMPGQEPGGSGGGGGPGGPGLRPHAVPGRRGRRAATLLLGLFAGTVLLLSGVGLGTLGATVIGVSRLAELQRQAARGAEGAAGTAAGTQGGPGAGSGRGGGPSASGASSALSGTAGAAGASPRLAEATLGLEIVDAEKAGAKIVAVHIPGPGYTAGLVRGDVLLTFGTARIDSATDLARAVDEVRPGKGVEVTVRHRSGGYQHLMVVPGIVT
ncbi:PDZ domain-containing protein [Streptomyces sp. yr375]|uniref:PDZ domain-containing protein n=1 Tax=Streptomyces sp. yr375 TaxID=1761906 RepID=UPI0008D40379|nr:PDZ domain-containing protein [Streptomyces sp. yr375]SER22619.1 PDZ domain-containing protein [Streptomyces sp. yr375]